MSKVDDSFYEGEQEEEKQLSLLTRFKAKLTSLFTRKKKEEPEAEEDPYTEEEDDFSNPYGEESKRSTSKIKHRNYREFTWWEWLIIMGEIVLVVYTVLVFFRIAPIF